MREGCSANQGAAWVLVMTPTVRAVPAKLDTIASMAVNDPRAMLSVIELSKASYRKTWQNLVSVPG